MAKTKDSQKEYIVTFMKNNMDVFLGSQAGSKADQNYMKDRFDELSGKLNALGPPCKNRTAWRKTWSDMRSRAKTKALLLEKNKKSKTPIKEKDELTELEKQILDLLSQSKVDEADLKNQNSADEEPDEEDVISEDDCTVIVDDSSSDDSSIDNSTSRAKKRKNISVNNDLSYMNENGSLLSETNSHLRNISGNLADIASTLKELVATLKRRK